MKYKVGDKVKVRSDLGEGKKYGSCSFSYGMKETKGKTVTIRNVNEDSYEIEEFGYNWTDEMFEGLEDGKMYASELMELARKEQEKYEGKRYKVVDGSLFYATGTLKSFKECVVRNGEIISTGNPYSLAVQSDSKVEEIKPEPLPVPFMEAVKAMKQGKYVGCTYDGETKVYGGTRFTTFSGDEAVTTNEILRGVWTIKE